MKKCLLMLALTVSFCLSPFIAQASEPPRQPPLVAAGSGVNLGITQILADAFVAENPGTEIKVPGSIGTRGAILAAADGAVMFGLISRPLKAEEKKDGFVELPYAQTPIVIAVHPTVTETEITGDTLTAIYGARKTRWRDDREIIVLSREPYDSGFMVLEKMVDGFKEAYAESREGKLWSVYFTDQDANRALATVRYAVGVTDLGMIMSEHLNIKPLKFNGVDPKPETLADGTYPLSRTLYFLYKEDLLTARAKAFLSFVRSEKGAQILKAHGYLPL